ncbi:hypothetical protein BY458DRAFT_439278 [Sporodiniella umbellata]|nr:hypothetical protein BY458DRAFT_439278 [Sporodiniella umbellata]
MVRPTPCQYCKQRRRKCEREGEGDACVRCVRLGKQCATGLAKDDWDEAYEELSYQAECLALALNRMEMQREVQHVTVDPVWELRVEGGRLVLESELKSFREFELYGQSFVRYLSPFVGTFQTDSLLFKKQVSSVIQNAVSAVAQVTAGVENKQYSESLLVQCIDPRIFLPRLVDLYFHCFNNLVPMLHENSYRARLASLTHVLEDPVTLAICATASVHSCPHAFFRSEEKRYFGEFFYRKSMAYLIEIFDEPGRELESLVVTNTLQTFWFTTLRFDACRKWAHVGSVLAYQLEKEYPEHRQGRKLKDRSQRVLYATIHRNCLYAHSILSLINSIADVRPEGPLPSWDPLDVLEDEQAMVKSMVALIHHVMALESNRTTPMFSLRSRMAREGVWMELTLEDIIRFERTVEVWWHSLPGYLRLGPGPMQCSKALIQGCDDPQQLLTCLYVHGLTINIQSNFLSPQEASHLSQVLKARAGRLVVYAAEMVLATVQRFAELNTFCFCKCLFGASVVD